MCHFYYSFLTLHFVFFSLEISNTLINSNLIFARCVASLFTLCKNTDKNRRFPSYLSVFYSFVFIIVNCEVFYFFYIINVYLWWLSGRKFSFIHSSASMCTHSKMCWEGSEIQYSLTQSFHPCFCSFSTYEGFHETLRRGRRWKTWVGLKLLDRLEPASKGA